MMMTMDAHSVNKHVLLGIVLSIGMLISLYLVYEHYAPSASTVCNFGEGLDCGVVNKSPYATLDGIFYLMVIDLGWSVPMLDIASIHPVAEFLTTNAFLGFLTLVFVMVLLYYKNKGKDFYFIEHEDIIKWIRGILAFGVMYGFYLFLIQHFVLKTYCVFCLALDITLITSLIIAWRLK